METAVVVAVADHDSPLRVVVAAGVVHAPLPIQAAVAAVAAVGTVVAWVVEIAVVAAAATGLS